MNNPINLGILAHVDAGKTSLTERLLFETGAIRRLGSVDGGDTQTDSLALERQRGITIKAAVASFAIGDVPVNLLDTPGHPDFIAEVERVLSVLDGAILVISAVEGVQPQTRVLMRALQRLCIPTLLFVNKIDRRGADLERVLGAIAERLAPAIVPMGAAHDVGTRDAYVTPYADADFTARLVEVLTDHDDALFAAYVDNAQAVSYQRLRRALAAQTGQALVHPVFFGSAIASAGVDALIAGIAELLPTAGGDADGPVAGTVFKIERGTNGEKIAYVRLFEGVVRSRDQLHVGQKHTAKVTALSVFDHGSVVYGAPLSAGQIGKLWGLGSVQIGDAIGTARMTAAPPAFAPPTLETIIVPHRDAERGALHAALAQLAEQDPLINLRRDEVRQELFVSLYGEVQKEVIETMLADDFGIAVEFRETTTICVERVVGIGAAVETINNAPNPFLATVGLRIEPAPANSGVTFRLVDELAAVPLYIYKSTEVFRDAIADAVRYTLRQGLCGWQVTDCLVTMTHSGYASPSSTAGDFRKLVPLVVMDALTQAGTVVCEPLQRFHLEAPADALGPALAALARLHATPQASELRGAVCVLEGTIPAARVHTLQQQLPGLTHGEGVLESAFDSYAPINGTPPTRPRSDANPLNRKAYLLHVLRRV